MNFVYIIKKFKYLNLCKVSCFVENFAEQLNKVTRKIIKEWLQPVFVTIYFYQARYQLLSSS